MPCAAPTPAILYRPEIDVLDEAASSLDETTKQYVTRNLIRLFNGKTLIIVSHNPDAWTAFDEKLILEDVDFEGRILHVARTVQRIMVFFFPC